MKILTLNTWQELGPTWRERWEVTLEGLRRWQPDILAFQELLNCDWAKEVRKLAGLRTLVFPDENGGLVLYSKFDVASWGITELSQSPLEEYLRYCLWAELKVRGERLVIFNTHLSWMLEDGATRRKQVEEVLQLIQEKNPLGESILMGDLNAPPDSPEIQQLIREGKFRDLFYEKHPNEKAFSWDNRNPYAGGAHHKMPDRRIDYLLVRGSGPLLKHPVSCDLVFTAPNAQGVWASDHFGVLAEFQ
jgi:endonuclease/exonuclease/phosphatase family metal-dependent hydrolase